MLLNITRYLQVSRHPSELTDFSSPHCTAYSVRLLGNHVLLGAFECLPGSRSSKYKY